MTAEPLDPAVARNDVRMDGVVFFRACASAGTAHRLQPGNYSYCVAIREGRLRLRIDFPAPAEIELAAGDVVAVSGLTPHSFLSVDAGPEVACTVFETLAMSEAAQAPVQLVVGCVPSEALALGSLTLGPILVRPSEHSDLARHLWRAVDMLEDEYAGEAWPDRTLVVRRLAEIMLVNMTRRLMAEREREIGPRSPIVSRQILQAVNAFLDAPERTWTLEQLAREAGMSRSGFADAFKSVTGLTPGRIVSRLRLNQIAHRLASDSLSVEAAAEEAGYSSSAAFVRAFQREFGETPARWRRARIGVAVDRRPARRGRDDARRRAP